MKTDSSNGKTKKDFPKTQEMQRAAPDVIVDFIFDAGCLFLSIQNIGTGVAHKVRIKFSERIYHIDGKTSAFEPSLISIVRVFASCKRDSDICGYLRFILLSQTAGKPDC